MKSKSSIFISLLAALLLLSPSSSFAEDRSKSGPKLFSVKLVSMGGDYSRKIANEKNQHPYDISEDAFLRMMRNFDYQNKKKAMAGWEEKKNPVFPEKIIVEAAPYLRAAFLKAKSDQKIEFHSESPSGETRCDIFIQKEEINWRFFSIRGIERNKGMWMLSKGYLQEYFGTGNKLLSLQGLLGGGNYSELSWIQMPILQFLAEVGADNKIVQGQGTDKEPDDGKDKLEKLKTLTALYHKKLVTTEDYRIKVDKLMRERAGEKLEIEKELEYLKILKDEKIITRDAYKQKKDILLDKY